MLKLAVSHYLKSIGDKFFHPNPDYVEWDNVDCLDVVIKRRPKWCWQKNTYIYDHFGINDLLDTPFSVDKSDYLKKLEPLTPSFSYSNKHTIKGEFGANIASLLSLDLSGNDTITVNMEIDGIMKQSIDFAVVAKELMKKKVNLKNKYLERLGKCNLNVICLVTQYIYITKPATIKVSVNVDCTGNNDEKPNIKLKLSDSANFDESKVKTITFDSGTRLAFDFAECLISPDGTIELIDRAEGFHKTHMIPEMFQDDVTDSTVKLQKGLTASGDIGELSKCLANMGNNNKLGITGNLLVLAKENKTDLKKLESFFVDCLQDITNKQTEIALSSYELKQIDHQNLLYLFKQVGVDNQKLSSPIKLKILKIDVIHEILMTIQSVNQLEETYLLNVQNIINDSSINKEQLLSYLEKVINPDFQDKSLFGKLYQNDNIKKLFLSVGILEKERHLNEYLVPTYILIHNI